MACVTAADEGGEIADPADNRRSDRYFSFHALADPDVQTNFDRAA